MGQANRGHIIVVNDKAQRASEKSGKWFSLWPLVDII